jgi:hypothetical protein
MLLLHLVITRIQVCPLYWSIHTADKVNYAQWNTAWTPQQENSLSEVRRTVSNNDDVQW